MFKRINNMKSQHQIIFSLIIAFAVISFWKGIWEMWDKYLFPLIDNVLIPNNYNLSLWVAIFTGVIILFLTNYIVKEFM